MANVVSELGDRTSHDVRPDFDSGRGYYWMKQIAEARAAASRGEPVHLPRKERKGLAEESFFGQVDRRLSRKSFSMGASFNKEGKLIREGV